MYGNGYVVTDCVSSLCACKGHTAVSVEIKVTLLNSKILCSCCVAEGGMLLSHHGLNDLLYRWYFDLLLRNY